MWVISSARIAYHVGHQRPADDCSLLQLYYYVDMISRQTCSHLYLLNRITCMSVDGGAFVCVCVSSYVYEREKKEWESKWEKEAKRKKLVDFYAQSISQPVNRCHYKEATWPRDDKTHNQPSCLTVCTTRPLREGKGRGERERSITQLLITHYSLFRPISLAQTVIIDFLLLKIASTAAFPSFPTLPSLQL